MLKFKGNGSRTELAECKICKKCVQRRSLRRHLQTHQEALFHCDICGKYKGKTKMLLAAHKKMVHKVGQDAVHDCIFCGKKCRSFSGLEAHLRCHTGERPYFCKICPGEFTRCTGIKMHLETHDSNRTPKFSCRICKKRFFQASHLKTHIQLHSELKPFKCSLCPKGFSNKNGLEYHMTSHTKEKPFACGICNKRFAHKFYIDSHIRMHLNWEKNFPCKICSKTFRTNPEAKLHLQKIHFKENFKFRCEKCGKRFYLNHELKRHELSHNIFESASKPFSCGICPRKFTLKCHLQTHIKSTHNK